MIIRSFSENTFLQLERADTEEYREIAVTASIDGIAISTGTWFRDPKPFLSAIAAFERNRRSPAELFSNAFTLRIDPDGPTGRARLSFTLVRDVFAFSQTGDTSSRGTLTFEGEIPVEGEWIGQMLRDFTELLQV